MTDKQTEKYVRDLELKPRMTIKDARNKYADKWIFMALLELNDDNEENSLGYVYDTFEERKGIASLKSNYPTDEFRGLSLTIEKGVKLEHRLAVEEIGGVFID